MGGCVWVRACVRACEISIIIISICQKLESVGTVQQKIKLLSPKNVL